MQPREAIALAERVLELFTQPFEAAGQPIMCGISIGIALAPEDGLAVDQLLKCADLALYRAKEEGRGIYRLFQAEMDARMQTRRQLELDLRHALKVGQFELHYQPLIDLRANAVTGMEALLRWRHPERGMVPPGEFVPFAEEIGLIQPLGEWVLYQACAAAAGWPGNLRVAVNLSAAQFSDPGLMSTIIQALREAGLPPDRLELEITEAVLLQECDATVAVLRELRAHGIHIAMDDFGTGYSSLSTLHRFPFDRVKIDQSFIRELGNRRRSDAIVHSVVALANELNMASTAEGVETERQLVALALAGCTDVQGHLFSPPVPGAEVAEVTGSLMAALRERSTVLPLGRVA
jgi:predicted signal transduction protein with EAL and GGDEF domain